MRGGERWLVLAMVLSGCGGAQVRQGSQPAGGDRTPVEVAVPQPGIGTMTATGARAFLASHPEALVLDVRNPDEWDDALGHIEGARLIPLPELPGRLAEIEAWKERPVVLVCRSGNRSRRAADLMQAAGFRRVINLEGGMMGWRAPE